MSAFEYPYTRPVTITFNHIDALGHVNNAVYLTYFEDVRIHYLLKLTPVAKLNDMQVIVAESTVRYLQPVFFGDEVTAGTRVASIGNKSFVMEYGLLRHSDNQLVASGQSVLVWYDYANRQTTRVPDEFREAVRANQGELPPAQTRS